MDSQFTGRKASLIKFLTITFPQVEEFIGSIISLLWEEGQSKLAQAQRARSDSIARVETLQEQLSDMKKRYPVKIVESVLDESTKKG